MTPCKVGTICGAILTFGGSVIAYLIAQVQIPPDPILGRNSLGVAVSGLITLIISSVVIPNINNYWQDRKEQRAIKLARYDNTQKLNAALEQQKEGKARLAETEAQIKILMEELQITKQKTKDAEDRLRAAEERSALAARKALLADKKAVENSNRLDQIEGSTSAVLLIPPMEPPK